MLIAAGANIRHVANNGATALILASFKGHVEFVKLLIEAGSNLEHATSGDSRTALTIASNNGHLEIVKLLIAAGSNLEHAASSNSQTTLINASNKGHLEIVKLLIAADANIHHVTNNGVTALSCAKYQAGKEQDEEKRAKYVEIVAILEEKISQLAAAAAASSDTTSNIKGKGSKRKRQTGQ